MESWKNKFIKEVNALTEKNVEELDVLMKRIGVDEKIKFEWIAFLKESLQDSYTHMLEEVAGCQNKLIDTIEELLQQSEVLCKRLRIKMPSHGSDNLSLSEEKKVLKDQIVTYEVKIKERLDELFALRKRQAEACKSLGCQPMTISDSPVLPTIQEMDEFANHVETLENEKFIRETKYLEIKCKILEIINELGIEPSLEIEKNVCSADDSLFMVTDYNMKWLDDYYESLMRQKDHIENEITNLREKVTLLWEIISEDIRSTNEFMQNHMGNSLDTLHALQNEVKRCENLKKANIEKFIKKMRSELVQLWDKCHLSSVERAKFQFLHDNLYTEDLLTFHDIEVEKMRKYYEENKDILQKLERRQEYWKRKLELDERANDPNRFKNRGGTLLKEERERNALVKKIADMEFELLQAAATYEAHKNEPFLSWGRTIPDIIEEALQEYESNKKQQLSAKKLQRGKSPTPSKSTLLSSALSGSRKNLLTLTPGTSGQVTPMPSGSRRTPTRIIPGVFSAAKRRLSPMSLFSGSKSKTPKTRDVVTPTIKINDRTISSQKSKRYSFEKKKRLEKIRRLSKVLEEKRSKLTNNDSMEYANFMNLMNEKEGSCRSTLFSAAPDTYSSLAQLLPSTPNAKSTPNKRPALSRTPTYTKLKTAAGSAMDI